MRTDADKRTTEMPADRAASGDEAGAIVRALSRQIDALAAAGKWAEVEACVVRLQREVINIPAAERRDALLTFRSAVVKAAAGARSAREHVSGKLAGLRRGKAARKAYELR